MSRWQRMLREMAVDAKPVNYRYLDAILVLEGLGFSCIKRDGSHRIWKLRTPNGTVKVMLVDSGHGTLPPGYIRRMLQMLQTAKLLPILDP